MRRRPRSVRSVILLRREPTRKIDLRGHRRSLVEVDSLRSRVRRPQLRGNRLRCRLILRMPLERIHIPNRTARLLCLMRMRRMARLHFIHQQDLTTPIPLMRIHRILNNHIITNNRIHGAGIIDNTHLSRQVPAAPKVVRWVGFLNLQATSQSKLSSMETKSVPMLSTMGDR